jgi:hypothetical protein
MDIYIYEDINGYIYIDRGRERETETLILATNAKNTI